MWMFPWVSLEVEADVANPFQGAPKTIRRKDKESGLGDVILMPVMFNQNVNKDLNINYRVAVYAPTGWLRSWTSCQDRKKFLDH